mgnify:CR=1 FL=1
MAFVRYTASADNTIVNTFQTDLSTRATGSNTGEADIVEIYSVYGRQTPYSSGSDGITPASTELSRFLIQFPITKISSDRSTGKIPGSGSVNFFLKLYNAPHSKTVPKNYDVTISAVSQSWQEGNGLDLTNYLDEVKNNSGSNWIQAKKGTNWTVVGGDYLTGSGLEYNYSFNSGLEDIDINVTQLVEKWIAGTQNNYGFGVRLAERFEAYFSASNDGVLLDPASGSVLTNLTGAQQSFYTKRFFARGTQYFFKRPLIEARWDDTIKDDRGNFYFSSSRAPAADNLNTIYLYNYIRGKLANLPDVGTGEILVSLYSGSADNTRPSGSKLELYDGNTNITGGYVSTGVYSCSIGIASSSTVTLYDVWHSGSREYYTGSIRPKVFSGGLVNSNPNYVISMRNLQKFYRTTDKVRLQLYTRQKNWQPNIYTVAKSTPEINTIVSASYRVVRLLDNYQAVGHGTASNNHTGLSYGLSGNYFDFDMSSLEPGYAYEFRFAFYDHAQGSWVEQGKTFKFKVSDE